MNAAIYDAFMSELAKIAAMAGERGIKVSPISRRHEAASRAAGFIPYMHKGTEQPAMALSRAPKKGTPARPAPTMTGRSASKMAALPKQTGPNPLLKAMRKGMRGGGL